MGLPVQKLELHEHFVCLSFLVSSLDKIGPFTESVRLLLAISLGISL
jgi:hypothetical protein